jgi:hypothetical protein
VDRAFSPSARAASGASRNAGPAVRVLYPEHDSPVSVDQRHREGLLFWHQLPPQPLCPQSSTEADHSRLPRDELHRTNGAQRRRMPTTLRSVLVGEVVGNVLNGLERLKDRVVIGGLFVAAK